jgi:Pyruvate/2-oxoacid:ferredoxin oxidoreductase delta subunit
MKIAHIDADACDRSRGCPVSRTCPRGAVRMLLEGPNAGAWTVDADRCSGCGVCVSVCPARVVTMIEG